MFEKTEFLSSYKWKMCVTRERDPFNETAYKKAEDGMLKQCNPIASTSVNVGGKSGFHKLNTQGACNTSTSNKIIKENSAGNR